MLHYYPELVHLDLIPNDGPPSFPPMTYTHPISL
jgi:hypothetical protein